MNDLYRKAALGPMHLEGSVATIDPFASPQNWMNATPIFEDAESRQAFNEAGSKLTIG